MRPDMVILVDGRRVASAPRRPRSNEPDGLCTRSGPFVGWASRLSTDYSPPLLQRIYTYFDQRGPAVDRCYAVTGEVCLRRPDSEMGKTIG